MAGGFTAREFVERSPQEVWAYLTDFSNAQKWMTGVEAMAPITADPIQVGTRLRFTSRGKQRESEITALEPGKRLELTSTQGGVTAIYAYSLEPRDNGTDLTLRATCAATGFWKLLHPIIVVAMKRSDSSHLTNLKTTMG